MSDIFISYSRKDQGFVKKLFDALANQKREAWVDWQGIPPTAEWLEEVYSAIDYTNAFIFVLSPDSISSEICQLEVNHAIEQNKRLIPVLLREINSADLHEGIHKINWLRMDEDSLESSLQNLLEALDTDLDWVSDHTRLTVRATEWDRHDRDASRLLRGKDLESAEQWLTIAPDKSLDPTLLQSHFITASRQISNKRQRHLLSGIIAGLLVAIGLAIFAWMQRNVAVDEANRARSSALSSQAVLALDNDHDPTLGFRYAAAAWKLNPSNSTAKNLMLRSQYGENTFFYRGKHYRPPFYQDIDTDIDFTAAHLSPDGKHIAVITYPPGVSQSEIHILDLKGKRLGKVSGQFKSFSEEGKYFATTAYANKTASVWNLDGSLFAEDKVSFEILNQLKGTFRLNENKILAVPYDSAVLVARDKTQKRIKPWTFVEGDPGVTLDVSYSYDHKLIAAYGQKRTFGVWNYKGNIIATFPKQNELITSSSFSPDKQYLAVSYSNGDIAIWNLKSNKKKELTEYDNKIVTLRGHTDTARSVEFTRNGNRLLSTARDGKIKVWDLESFPVTSIVQPKKSAKTIHFYPNYNRIIATSYPAVNIMDYDGKSQYSAEGYFTQGMINSVAVSADQKMVAAVNNKNLKISMLDDGAEVDFKAHENNILSVTFSLTGRRVITSDLDTIKIWDLKANHIATLNVKFAKGSVYKNTWKPYLVDTTDHHYLLIQTDKNIRLLDLKGNEIKTLPGKIGSGMMDKDSFSSDLKHMIITGGDHRLSVFNLAKRKVIAQTDELPARESFQIARFSPGTPLVYAVLEFRGVVYIWDWENEKMTFINTSYQLESAQVIPALDQIVTKAIDGRIRFWDMDGTEQFVIENQASGWVKLSPDGRYLAVQNRKDKGWPVELWSFDPELLVKQAEQIGIPGVDYP